YYSMEEAGQARMSSDALPLLSPRTRGRGGEREDRARRMADHALGGAAAQRIENAGMSRRRHADEVDVELGGGGPDRLHDVAGSKDDRRQGARRRGAQRRRGLTDVKEIDRDIRAGQKSAEALNRIDGAVRRRREIDRNQHALELDVAVDLIDETA